MKTRTILLAAACAAACTTQNNSALVITTVVAAKAETSTTTPPVTNCKFDASADESSFQPINLASDDGTMGAVVHNAMPATNSNNSLNLDAAVFEAHQAVIRVEFPGGTPPGVSVPNPIIVPVGGVVESGATVSIPVALLPQGAITGTVPDKTVIRTTFHIEGKLLGGSSVHTSEREYLFKACPLCADNACL